MTAAVFTASLSSLFYEILLSYFFAETQWNNLYFFVISISLFGYSAGGLIISLLAARKKRPLSLDRLITPGTIALSLGIPLSYLALNSLGIDYFRIPFEGELILLLLLQYCILAIPFTAAGTVIAAAFSSSRKETHRVYAGTMAGSAAGVLLALGIISSFGIPAAVLLCAVLPVFSRCFVRSASFIERLLSILASAAMVLAFFTGPACLRPVPSSYKPLSNILASRGGVRVYTENSVHGRVDIVESPLLRSSPGLSLSFRGTIPTETAAVLNADRTVILYNLDGDLSFAHYSLPAAAEVLGRDYRRALIIEKGTAAAVPLSLAYGCRNIDILESVPEIAEILSRSIKIPGITVYTHAGAVEDGLYDLVFPDDPGSTLPGLRSLDEQYHLTTEAFRRYVDTLSEEGLIVLTRHLVLPPTDSIRMFRTALAALEPGGARYPGQHIAMLRNWNTYCLLISKRPFTQDECMNLINFAEKMGFDMVYYPGITDNAANRFNVFDRPYHYEAVKDALAGKETIFDTRPETDARPYVYSFLRLKSLKKEAAVFGSRTHIILSSGDVLVWILFAVALIVALVFLVIPVLFISGPKQFLRIESIGYFSLLGIAFMFVETGFIKLYTLPTGDSLISFSLVLSVILIASAVGSYTGKDIGKKGLFILLIILGACLCILAFAGLPFLHILSRFPGVFLHTGLVILTALPGAVMGIPFPAALRLYTPLPASRAYAWAANGVFSVLSSILAVPVSLYAGIPVLFAAAGFAYGLAAVLTRQLSSNR